MNNVDKLGIAEDSKENWDDICRLEFLSSYSEVFLQSEMLCFVEQFSTKLFLSTPADRF